MSNMLLLFKSDLRKLFANVVSCIITIGLIVMPSIFVWYNLLACWNVFENTGGITVAVANDDEGYKSDLIPVKIDIGDMVVSELRANDQIGWTFTDADEAIDGTSSGKYYAAVVIPKQFSRDLLDFYSDGAEKAQILYYVNEKVNAISPKITTIGADTVSTEVNTVFAQTLAEVSLGVIESISNYANSANIGGQVAALVGHVKSMGDDMSRVANVVGMHVKALDSTQRLLDDASDLLSSAGEEVRSMMGTASDGATSLQDAISKISDAQQDIEGALDSVDSGLDSMLTDIQDSGLGDLVGADNVARIEQNIRDAQSQLSQARESYNENLKPNLDRLASDSGLLAQDVQSALEQISQTDDDLSYATGSVKGVLSNVTSEINDAIAGMNDSAAKLQELANRMSEALANGDTETLKTILASDVEAISSALASPVGIKRIAVFPSESFGSAMAPLYTALAMFIGSLLIMVVVKPKVSNEVQAKMHNPKPRQMLLGRFGCLGCLSLAQTTVMGLGNLLFLQVQAVNPLLLMVAMWVSGLVFTFIIYVLVLAFANLGKAIAVCLLIVQVTGCGGSFPLQLLPGFVQWLSPLLPATYSVNAMRAAMFGIYNGDFWIQIGCLLVFLIPAALIGFVLRKPFEKFMKWYVSTVESTEIIG